MDLNLEQRALVSVADHPSPLASLLRFLPFAAAFSLRHLTIGTYVRCRRRYLRWRRRQWVI